MRVAALTMVYNESVFLPLWLRHYARQVGAAHCYVLDHGSDDGSTENLPVAVTRLGRSPLDEALRAQQVGEMCVSLLRNYDAVVHTDADELLLADPRTYDTLAAYADATSHDVTTAIGLELHHLPDEEAPLDPLRPLGAQRRWVRFNAAMCKPALIRKPVAWCPGFHCCDAPLAFDRLYMVHLRHADLGIGLARLARTRALVFSEPTAGQHQRVSDAAFEAMVRAVAGLPRHEHVRLDPAGPPLLRWLDAMRQSRAVREHERYKLDLTLAGDALWAMPESFRTAL